MGGGRLPDDGDEKDSESGPDPIRPRADFDVLKRAAKLNQERLRAEARASAEGFLEEIASDSEILDRWFTGELVSIAALQASAEHVRTITDLLAAESPGATTARFELERRLLTARQKMIHEDHAVPNDPPTWVSALEGISAFSRDVVTWSGNPDARTRQSIDATRNREWPRAHFKELERAADALQAAVDDFFRRRQQALEAARLAVQLAHRAADGALNGSAVSYRRRSVHGRSWRAIVVSLAPFLAFLLVAAAGVLVRVSEPSTKGAIAVLLSVSAIAGILAARWRLRGASIAGLGIGASLSVFFALYLLASWVDPGSVLMDGNPIVWLGEGGLLSLTIAVTAGTLGVDLYGPARVIAFIQILLSLVAVVAAARWSWLYVIDRLPYPGPGPEEG